MISFSKRLWILFLYFTFLPFILPSFLLFPCMNERVNGFEECDVWSCVRICVIWMSDVLIKNLNSKLYQLFMSFYFITLIIDLTASHPITSCLRSLGFFFFLVFNILDNYYDEPSYKKYYKNFTTFSMSAQLNMILNRQK